ncbi:MAG: bifunctional oligoribonuclease/PAP phosphatase NrnA [Deltaproteobacteria bacterium]|nr:bifunctional oligoribonuclease/PAP phosphatase NrnA [Deltaproteobacteria bacterium]
MLNKIIGIINNCQSFLITSHVRLDGDAIGSEMAMYQMLTHMGKIAVVYNQDETPGNYRFLPGTEEIVHTLPDLERYEVAVVLDCSDLERIGDEASRIVDVKRIINIDHHISNGNFGGFAYVDHQASSTGELLYRLIKAMGVDFTKDMATSLFAAILTDTGGFRYRNTKKDTLIASGHLIEKGADPQWISENIYESNPPSKIRLLTRVLDTLTFDWSKKVGYMVVSRKTLEETGALMEHTEGFVDVPRSIQGIEVSILFNEVSDQYFKLSLRSKGKVNVERVARTFGGGGHINAAACQIEGDLETIRQRVLDVIGTAVES